MSAFIARPTEVHTLLTSRGIEDINTVSSFLASPSHAFDFSDPAHTVYVLIGSAILPTAEAIFDHVSRCTHPVTLVLAGGIGHSTSLLYDAVSRHPRYSSISHLVKQLPEAQVFKLLMTDFWPDLGKKVDNGILTLLIDDRSTNCGANAIETKRELDGHGIKPKRLFIVQDPTMNRRTFATFEKVFQGSNVELLPWSFFPRLSLLHDGTVSWEAEDRKVENHELWEPSRFISLILGEIPRLRDDEKGYGPRGAGFIAHVDIPEAVEQAWSRLNTVSVSRR
ncbi:hypothetical protein I302_101626 [Kwoniella bestiolae CBS 10118]|uniref:DUF218 domain-containing protein n=1 Tax=Kwoniella bestiolae CBS 10118 TaxID=1296100 RepID=A0A1B9GCS1_9TREE|nr:hypothetical protein I302_00307 [Kwoniella bestiolae CBS 10118]OCF28818.1 hypothetical protein I302_00307 [Kwoniella bestiolae CBS 10118]